MRKKGLDAHRQGRCKHHRSVRGRSIGLRPRAGLVASNCRRWSGTTGIPLRSTLLTSHLSIAINSVTRCQPYVSINPDQDHQAPQHPTFPPIPEQLPDPITQSGIPPPHTEKENEEERNTYQILIIPMQINTTPLRLPPMLRHTIIGIGLMDNLRDQLRPILNQRRIRRRDLGRVDGVGGAVFDQ